MSLTLALYQAAGFRIEKLNILGNEVAVDRPEALSALLWVAFFYLLLRYYQALRDLHDREIAVSYTTRRNQAIKSSVEKRLRTIRWDLKDFGSIPDDATIVGESLVWTERGPLRQTWTADAKATWTRAPKVESYELPQIEISVGVLPNVWFHLQGLLEVILHTSKATEYVLPFLLALLPLVAAVAAYVWPKGFPA